MPIERRSIASLIPYRDNPRTHSQGQIDKLASLIHKYGFHDSHAAAIDENGVVIWGHGRIEAAKQAGLKEIPVEVLTGLSDADKQALRIADNAVGEQSGWDMELLAKELESLSQADYQLELLALDVDLLEGLGDVLDPGVLTEGGDWQGGIMGGDLQGDEDEDDEGKSQPRLTLSDRFVVPPFSVLDARQGYWQERKRQWLALGIQSELGRGGGMTYADHDWQLEKLGKIQAPH